MSTPTEPPPAAESLQAIIGECPAILAALRTLARVAASTATVLLSGERGTGKEMFARALHRCSGRAAGPFVAVDCAALPESPDEEFFGRESRAITDELRSRAGRVQRASGGTLFLDEVGALSPAIQERLLHALRAREVAAGGVAIPIDVRVVATTARDLDAEVAAGRFHGDLYRRLSVVTVALPPLRERGDDIRLLAEYCVAQAACAYGSRARVLACETLALLLSHPWPGNVRQLCHAVESGAILADGPVLLPAHLPADVRSPDEGFARAVQPAPLARPDAREARDEGELVLLPLEELERRHIRQALALTRGHLARAAELLGIHRNTLRRKLAEYEVDPSEADADRGRTSEPPSIPTALVTALGAALPIPREIS